MTGMEDVLARLLYKEGCWCGDCEYAGWDSCPECRQTCHIIARALAAAGFGNLHDAWAEGHHAGWDDRDTDPEFTPNPHPPKVSET